MAGSPADHVAKVGVLAGSEQGGQIPLGPGAALFSAQRSSHPRGPAGRPTCSHLAIEEVDLIIGKTNGDLLGHTSSIPRRDGAY